MTANPNRGMIEIARKEEVERKAKEMIRAVLPELTESSCNIFATDRLRNFGSTPEKITELVIAFEREFDLHDMPEGWLKDHTPFSEIVQYLYLFGDLPDGDLF